MQKSHQNKPWYDFSTGGITARAQAIQKYRSPRTIADEIMLILKWIVQPLLVVYCMVLSFSSYQAFFEHNFSPLVASLGAGLLCVVMEFGKIKIGGYVFNKPFLQGWDFFKSSFADFSVWGGSLLFMLFTFGMSVKNSTEGAHALSMMKGTQAHSEVFTPNTADIDAQIASVNSRIEKNQGIKWRGTVTVDAQRAIKKDAGSAEKLIAQREKMIADQRTDYERRQSQNDQYTATGANVLMASGGWVEALQLVTLFLMGACMAVVGGVMDQEQQKQQQQPGFQSQTAHRPINNNPINNETPLFMFNRQSDGQVRPAADQQPPTYAQGVTHQAPGVSHHGDDTLKIARQDSSRWFGNFGSKPNGGNGKHNPANTAGRITEIIDNLRDTMRQPGFTASYSAVVQTYNHFVVLLPKMAEKGWPYSDPDGFLDELLQQCNSIQPA